MTGNEKRRAEQFNSILMSNEDFVRNIKVGTTYGKDFFGEGLQFGYSLYARALESELKNYHNMTTLANTSLGAHKLALHMHILIQLPEIKILLPQVLVFKNSYLLETNRPSRSALKNIYFKEGVTTILKYLPWMFKEWFNINSVTDIKLETVDKTTFKELFNYLAFSQNEIIKRFIEQATHDLPDHPQHIDNVAREKLKKEFENYIENYLSFYKVSLNTLRSKGFLDAKFLFDETLKTAVDAGRINKDEVMNIDFLFTPQQLSRVRFVSNLTIKSLDEFSYYQGFTDFFRYGVYMYKVLGLKKFFRGVTLPNAFQCISAYNSFPFTDKLTFMKKLKINHGDFDNELANNKFESLFLVNMKGNKHE